MRKRGPVIAAVVGCVALVACAGALALAGAGLVYVRSAGWLGSPTPRPTRDPGATPRSAPTPDAQILAEMDAVQDWVVRQRGLQPSGEGVTRVFVSSDEMVDRTRQQFEADTSPEEVQDEARLYAVLGLMEPGLDLYSLYLRLYSEGIAGQYDLDTGELIVVSDAGRLNVYERVTFAHEYGHALQDQNYDIRGLGFSDEGWETDAGRAAAVQALLEGDATLLDEQYQGTLSLAERREYERLLNGIDVSVYFTLPEFLLQDFFFPYSQGLDFVRRYYAAGGWARVDEVWRDPPSSTEHILHPERYEAGDDPLPVPRPVLTDTLGAGWRQIDQNNLGEWTTYLVLAYGDDPDHRLSRDTAGQAAEGWGGDSYTLFYNDDQDRTVLALHWQWDTQDDADEFNAVFQAYANRRFGTAQADGAGFKCWQGGERHCLYVNGAHSLWLAAPDQATIEAVLKAFPDVQ